MRDMELVTLIVERISSMKRVKKRERIDRSLITYSVLILLI